MFLQPLIWFCSVSFSCMSSFRRAFSLFPKQLAKCPMRMNPSGSSSAGNPNLIRDSFFSTSALSNQNASYSTTLKGKTVVVTAGNQGGGAVIAYRYAASGANVVVVANKSPSLDRARVNDVAAKIIESGGEAMTLEVDLGDSRDIRSSVEKILERFGKMDIVINNYSIFNFKKSQDTTSDEFHTVIKNIYATLFFSQACINALKQSDNPHVINIAPPLDMDSAKEACENHLLFSLSKYGMSFCTLGMSKEFSEEGIAFNSLWQERPVATQTLTTNFDDEVTRGSNKPEIYAEAAYLISLKPSKTFTGNFCIDEEILREAGIELSQYAVDPTATPVKDIFLPGANYDLLKGAMQAKQNTTKSFK